ncbi:positive regulation of renal water transport [Branchiostoma belcheri]|nr:positive regulation of renal water transport [Branchiostoma belcheri]
MAASKPQGQQQTPGPSHNFRLQFITWNVCDTTPLHVNVAPLFRAEGPPPDLIAIGLQEAPGNPATAVIFEDSWGNACMKHLCQRGYVKIRTERMQAILLHVFVKLEHLAHIRWIKTAFTRTGVGGYWGNKGAVTVRMDLYGNSVCITNTHLAAHLEQNEIRIQEFHAITEAQRFPGCRAGTIMEHDFIFWIGDLNFRLDPIDYEAVIKNIADGRFQKLLEFDQLKEAQREGLAFSGFSEGNITFQPTYKFDKGTTIYDTSEKQRKPGWCDRILWRTRPGAEVSVTQHSYSSLPHIKQSDHSPVTSIFSIQVDLNKNQPLVRFEPVRNWMCGYKGVASYSVVMDIPTSGWDWIGLYKVGFSHPKDYHTYVWGESAGFGKGKRGCMVLFEPPYMPDEPGCYLLCYWSTHFDCIIGVSEPFQITKPPKLEEAVDALTFDKRQTTTNTEDKQEENVCGIERHGAGIEQGKEGEASPTPNTDDNQEQTDEKAEGVIEQGKEETQKVGKSKSDLEATTQVTQRQEEERKDQKSKEDEEHAEITESQLPVEDVMASIPQTGDQEEKGETSTAVEAKESNQMSQERADDVDDETY